MAFSYLRSSYALVERTGVAEAAGGRDAGAPAGRLVVALVFFGVRVAATGGAAAITDGAVLGSGGDTTVSTGAGACAVSMVLGGAAGSA
jgi:hypothetical protein